MRQGEVFWLSFTGKRSEPDGRRPAVVVQHDRFNRSAIQTTVVAAITSSLRLAAMPGNVRLRRSRRLQRLAQLGRVGHRVMTSANRSGSAQFGMAMTEVDGALVPAALVAVTDTL